MLIDAMYKKLQPRIAAWALIVLTSVALWVRYPGKETTSIPGDFSVYLKAWQRASTAQTPYVASEFSPYKYSPGALATFQFLPSDPASAWKTFATVSILLMALAL